MKAGEPEDQEVVHAHQRASGGGLSPRQHAGDRVTGDFLGACISPFCSSSHGLKSGLKAGQTLAWRLEKRLWGAWSAKISRAGELPPMAHETLLR